MNWTAMRDPLEIDPLNGKTARKHTSMLQPAFSGSYSETRVDASRNQVSDRLSLYQLWVPQVPILGPGKAQTQGRNYAVKDLAIRNWTAGADCVRQAGPGDPAIAPVSGAKSPDVHRREKQIACILEQNQIYARPIN
jgi:hypothetical protein